MIIIDVFYAILSMMLVVSGLAIVFGILRIINMAHGEFIMLGAYVSYYSYNINQFLGLMLAPVATGLAGLLLYWLIVRHVQQRLIDSILATWGIALVLKYGMTIAVGSGSVTLSPIINGNFYGFPVYRILIMIVSMIFLCGLYLLFFKTRFGLRTRAVIQNPILSVSSGINNQAIRTRSYAIGSAVAGFSGALLAPTLSISPLLGDSYLIPSFLSVLLGGMDSIIAPLIGAGFIAGFEGMLTRLITPVSAHVATLLSVIILLKLFPSGLVKALSRRVWNRR